jgi:ATP-dependent DNA helicase RecQ
VGEGAHRVLFEELRAVRKRLADEAGVPPFVVFSDATLLEMAASRPGSEDELLSITGVGAHKLRKYGGAFLQAINLYLHGQEPDNPGDSPAPM